MKVKALVFRYMCTCVHTIQTQLPSEAKGVGYSKLCHTEETSLWYSQLELFWENRNLRKDPGRHVPPAPCVFSALSFSIITFSGYTHADMAQQQHPCAQGEQKINFTNCSCLFINADNWRGQGEES